MEIQKIYTKIMEDLARGERGLVRFTSEELEILRDHLNRKEDLEKVLCLIEHSAGLDNHFETPLINLLFQELPDHLTIFALNCARKHIIQARFREGRRLDYNFLEILKKYLSSHSPEVVEWTLRTIEECGNQGVYFLKELDKIKPPPWKWFNPHQRAVREIIALLERRWSHFEKPKSR